MGTLGVPLCAAGKALAIAIVLVLVLVLGTLRK